LRRNTQSLTRPVLLGGALAAGLVAALPGVASAHVTIHPDSAPQGGYTELTVRVPTESATAATTAVEVDLPDPSVAPLASVLTEPVPGWTAVATTTKLATPVTTDDGQISQVVTRIVWTAAPGSPGIPVGSFQDFPVSVGPLPKVGSLTFKALQTYSDGSVVRWIDAPAPAGQPEPAHPAPTLTLTAAATTGATTGPSVTARTTAAAAGSSDGTARALGIVGVVLGALGLALGGVAVLRRRSA
jgi:periplasmic copper chaperone A